MKKTILTLITISAIFSCWLIIRKFTTQNNAKFTVCILQTASHPALDAAKKGFTNKLKSLLQNDVEFIIKNAQGSITNMHAIAQQCQANPKINGFFAIATPAVQAIYTLEKNKPIFIAAVTDPHSLGLINPNTNACGTTDMINVQQTVNLLNLLVPNAKNIGLLYTSGETNSIFLAQSMRAALKAKNLNVLDFTVTGDTDIPLVTELACRKCDVILCPTDNTVAATIGLISTITNKYKKPLIVSDNLLVAQGALAASGIDYEKSGEQTAKMAYNVLINYENPKDIGIQQTKTEQVYINNQILNELNLTLPKTLTEQVILV